eukprot:TRINITY_DN25932_c0_g1_i3.p2 TRINITY_DN25932_c0_g1~~TRINITY_DN25932_c0_g1_i3.p2  ORF type:complete len:106 (-),score=27.24 TRINITY_DN25932_c0_g1_i3:461-778(-)
MRLEHEEQSQTMKLEEQNQQQRARKELEMESWQTNAEYKQELQEMRLAREALVNEMAKQSQARSVSDPDGRSGVPVQAITVAEKFEARRRSLLTAYGMRDSQAGT